MNINKIITGGIDPKHTTRQDQSPSGNSNTEAKSSSGFTDQVKLSASSKNIQQIEAEIKNLPDVDDSTVDRIRNAVSQGDYSIDYQKLAGKMLDFEDSLN